MNEIDAFLDSLDHPKRREIDSIRTLIVRAVPALRERIKWNAPSFGSGDDDCITLKLYPPRSVGVVFHRGAKPAQVQDLKHLDPDGLLKWAAPDRGVIHFTTGDEVSSSKDVFMALVKRWSAAVAD